MEGAFITDSMVCICHLTPCYLLKIVSFASVYVAINNTNKNIHVVLQEAAITKFYLSKFPDVWRDYRVKV